MPQHRSAPATDDSGPPPRPRRVWRGAALLFALAALGAVYWHLAGQGMTYEWQWNRVWRHFGRWTAHGFTAGPLLEGLCMTLGIAAAGFCLSTALGLAAAVGRLSPWPFCRFAAGAYVELLRNTPLLLQLFFVYFLLSPLLALGPFGSAVLALGAFEGAYMAELFRAGLLSVPRAQWEAALSLGFGLGQALRAGVALGFAPPGQMDRMLAAVMALGLYEGAYVAEIVRGSVESVAPGQWDAARALGFSRRQSLRLVILPQAARIAIPPLAGQTISTFKDSALASLISLPELTFQSLEVMAVSQMTFEIWISAGALYLLVGLACAALGRLLERRCARHERPALRGTPA